MAARPVEAPTNRHGYAGAEYLPIYRTDFTGAERAYVMKCFEDNQLSAGNFVRAFEDAFASMTGARHAICVSSGTAALHLVLHALGIGSGDEVIVPSLTFVATANAVAMTGAKPVFVDSDRNSWLITPETVRARLTPRTKAVVPAHLYSGVCDMVGLRHVVDEKGLYLVEDCAQAIGASHGGRSVGKWGAAGTFSFFGNKTITTGEGGMVITDSEALAERLRSLRNQASSSDRRYWHHERGFNYKITDLAAAVGLAQLERLRDFLAKKRSILEQYRGLFSGGPCSLQEYGPETESGAWLFSLLLPKWVDRGNLVSTLHHQGIEVRPVFNCLHAMPAYRRPETFPVAERIAELGISLPSYPGLSEENVNRIAAAVLAATQCATGFSDRGDLGASE